MSAAALLVIVSIVLVDGGLAAVVMIAAAGYGLLLLRWLGLAGEPRRVQLLVGTGLGLAALALGLLGLGSIGLLHRPAWIAVVALGLGVAIMRGRRLLISGKSLDDDADGRPGDTTKPVAVSDARLGLMWLCVAPFAALALVAASCPPGYLWPAEGNGYDVLEYHFGAPKEYWVAGRIAYLPHNLYSNLPFNAEMLYLLAFVLRGSPWEAVYAAQMLNVLLAALAVAGAWLAGRELRRGAGVLAALAVATCPFTTYLCGVAYVENGMLAMIMLSLACLMRAACGGGPAGGLGLAGGVLAGAACGFKLTAGPMAALPLAICWAAFARSRRGAGLFVLGAAVTLAPWLVKNFVATGNPVFPLGRSVFRERAGVWTDEAAARWHEGHLPAPAERTLFGARSAFSRRVLTNPMFGMVGHGVSFIGWLVAGAACARLSRRDPWEQRRWSAVWMVAVLWLAVDVTWFRTHLIDRFAFPLVAPMAVGWALCATLPGPLRRVAVAVIVVAVGWNLRTIYGRFAEARVFEAEAFGADHLMRSGEWPGYGHVPRLNAIHRGGGRVLMVGEARGFYLDGRPTYHVVFSRNPFAEAMEAARSGGPADAVVRWLREQGYSHVYVDWTEIARLSRSRYGFWPGLKGKTPADYEAWGLRVVEDFEIGGRVYSTLFGVRG